MDENMNMKDNGHHWGCMCGMCKGGMGGMHGWGHHHGPLHILIKIVILVVVFWLGMQFGELNVYRFGPGGMMGGYGGYYRGGMMGGYGYGNDGNYYYGPTSATSSTQ